MPLFAAFTMAETASLVISPRHTYVSLWISAISSKSTIPFSKFTCARYSSCIFRKSASIAPGILTFIRKRRSSAEPHCQMGSACLNNRCVLPATVLSNIFFSHSGSSNSPINYHYLPWGTNQDLPQGCTGNPRSVHLSDCTGASACRQAMPQSLSPDFSVSPSACHTVQHHLCS